jgi:hypothetical protein
MREHRGPSWEERFWKRVVIGSPNECWLWTGSTTGAYGSMIIRGKHWFAHRVSWMTANGPIPEGALILHSCDVPLCVNPNHLRAGDNAMNMKDAVEHGRGSFNRGGRCVNGHEYSPDNLMPTGHQWKCKTCYDSRRAPMSKIIATPVN